MKRLRFAASRGVWRDTPALALAFTLGIAAPVWAGPGAAGASGATTPADEARREARRAAHERLRNEVMDQMRAMRMWKLTEELKLDQPTAATVFPTLAQYDDRAREIGRERREIAREVLQQTRSDKPDETKLREFINRLLANQQKRNALDDERFKALRPALSPMQQAKLLLLLPRLEDDFRRRIREAKEEQRRADGEDVGKDHRLGGSWGAGMGERRDGEGAKGSKDGRRRPAPPEGKAPQLQ